MLKFLKNTFQLIIFPGRGWEDVSHSAVPAADLSRDGFYPLLAVASLACMLRLLYDGDDISFIAALQNAIITFTVYFATLFLAQSAMGACVGKWAGVTPSENNISTFVVYNLSIMVLFSIIANVVPIQLEILKFLPVYAGFVIWKGTKYLDIDADKVGQYMFLSVFTIVVPPYLLKFLFVILLPAAN